MGEGSALIEGLDADKIYYVRLYALNSAGEDWTRKRISSQAAAACKIIYRLVLECGLMQMISLMMVLQGWKVFPLEVLGRINRGSGRDMDNFLGDPQIKFDGYGK